MKNEMVKVIKIQGGYRVVWAINEQPYDTYMFISVLQAQAEADRINAIYGAA